MEDEDDLPELSDSGDEAAWEDEDDADLPHDKQQTPCLFCDRFVHPSARRHPQGAGPCGYLWSAVEPERPALKSLNQWSDGLLRRQKHSSYRERAMNWKAGYTSSLRQPQFPLV